MMSILIIVTSVAMYESGNLPTELWLSELTQIYHRAKQKNYKIMSLGTLIFIQLTPMIG